MDHQGKQVRQIAADVETGGIVDLKAKVCRERERLLQREGRMASTV